MTLPPLSLPWALLLLAALGLLAFGAAVVVSEVAWAVKHRAGPRPLASLIGLLLLGLGAGLGWLFWGRA